MTDDTLCSGAIWDRHIGRAKRLFKAKVVRDGKGYCMVHDPEVAKKKDQDRNARWEKARKESERSQLRREVADELLKRVENTTSETDWIHLVVKAKGRLRIGNERIKRGK